MRKLLRALAWAAGWYLPGPRWLKRWLLRRSMERLLRKVTKK